MAKEEVKEIWAMRRIQRVIVDFENGEVHMPTNVAMLATESSPKLTDSKGTIILLYNHEEPNSAKHFNKLGSEFSSRAFW